MVRVPIVRERHTTLSSRGVLPLEKSQLPKSKDLGLCEAYTEGSLHKLNGFLQ